jgi:hypothetical protein
MAEDLGARAGDAVDEARDVLDARMARARDVYDEQRSRVGHAVDVGRKAARDAKAELERGLAETRRAYASRHAESPESESA